MLRPVFRYTATRGLCTSDFTSIPRRQISLFFGSEYEDYSKKEASPIQFVVRFCNTACRNFTHSTFVERKVSRRSLNPTVLRSRSTLQGVERGCVGAYPMMSSP